MQAIMLRALSSTRCGACEGVGDQNRAPEGDDGGDGADDAVVSDPQPTDRPGRRHAVDVLQPHLPPA